jgi:hypothetical protein
VPEQDRSRLFLFVLGVAAVHALCLAAVLPALFTLPGQDAGIAQGAIKQDAIVRDTIVNVEVMPSPESSGVLEAPDSPAASLASTPDSSNVTSALPDIPENADTAPGDTVTPESAPVTAATPATSDLVGSASPVSSPPATDNAGTVAAADPATTAALPQDEAKPATTVSLPTERPKPAVKSRTTAAKIAKPHIRRQASVTRTQSRGMFGGFFQSEPRPRPQRTTTTTR